MATPIFDALVSRHRFAAMADAWCGAEVDPDEDAQNEPILGEPGDVLAEFGFPEPLRDEHLHPVMAGVLSGHLRAGRGQS